MKFSFAALAVVATVITVLSALAQACVTGTAQEINGNWYCAAVDAISYTNFGIAGSYNKITSMQDGVCLSEKYDYSGAMAPMDGEVRLLVCVSRPQSPLSRRRSHGISAAHSR